jgi:hypothetical protein
LLGLELSFPLTCALASELADELATDLASGKIQFSVKTLNVFSRSRKK